MIPIKKAFASGKRFFVLYFFEPLRKYDSVRKTQFSKWLNGLKSSTI
jgi:hypothetical protein